MRCSTKNLIYKAALFATDGDWVTDYRGCETIEEVEDYLANQGSRWIFYPYAVVIKDHGSLTLFTQRIVSAPEPFENFKGYSLRSFGKFLSAHRVEFRRYDT